MPNPELSTRAQQKARSRERLLSAASRMIRAQGMAATSIDAVCEAAGLTRGTFYSHFSSKEELVCEVIHEAAAESRPLFIGAERATAPEKVPQRLARRYCAEEHVAHPEVGCVFASLASIVGLATTPGAVKRAFESELIETVRAAAAALSPSGDDESPAPSAEALAMMSMLVGTLTLARACDSEETRSALLQACINHYSF
jgi:TetR/AcrR family transcriptional repressor of nem operon